MNRFPYLLGAIVTGLALQSSARCEMLATYNFSDHNSAVDLLGPNVTATNFLTGGGLTKISYAGSANARGFSPSSSVTDAEAGGNYWTFTVAAETGYTLDLSTLTFDDKRGSKGPDQFELDVNGTLIGPARTATTSYVSQSYDLSAFTGLTTATFKFLAWNASNNGSSAQWYLDNIILSGALHALGTSPSLADVPAPPSLVLFATGAIPILGYIRRVRRRKLRCAA
jgi:hypothetical protein